jgi:hypothetical protein
LVYAAFNDSPHPKTEGFGAGKPPECRQYRLPASAQLVQRFVVKTGGALIDCCGFAGSTSTTGRVCAETNRYGGVPRAYET